MASNWTLVVCCAIELCLKQQTSVNHAIRDYTMANIDQLSRADRDGIIKIIEDNLPQVPPHWHVFWKKFQKTLDFDNDSV